MPIDCYGDEADSNCVADCHCKDFETVLSSNYVPMKEKKEQKSD